MTKDEAQLAVNAKNDSQLAVALGVSKSTVCDWGDILPRQAEDKVLAAFTRARLEEEAIRRGLILADGTANVGRMLAVEKYQSLLDAVSERGDQKAMAERPGSPGGLMIQINKRIKLALGHPVPSSADDSEEQEVVAMIRQKATKMLRDAGIDFTADDWKEKDTDCKNAIYAMIDRTINTWRA